MRKIISKKAQEEMLGFVLIVVVVLIILLVFLMFAIKKPSESELEDYKVSSFIQSFLQYTTKCRDIDNLKFRSVKELIFDCSNNKECLNQGDSCEILKSELNTIVEKSWIVDSQSPIKGYTLNITSETKDIIYIKEGNLTNNFKGASQPYTSSSGLLTEEYRIYFTAYY